MVSVSKKVFFVLLSKAKLRYDKKVVKFFVILCKAKLAETGMQKKIEATLVLSSLHLRKI